MNGTSFPCLVCGKELERAFRDAEGQPADGVMCETHGNYGSTVYDSMDGEALAFNVCDDCLVAAGEQGRIYTYRKWRPIDTDDMNFVGRERLDRPYIPWRRGLAPDNDRVYVPLDELEAVAAQRNVDLRFSVEEIREYVKRQQEGES